MSTSTRQVYGAELTPSVYRKDSVGVIASPERTSSGNVALRVGRMSKYQDEGWRQTEHVVLSPEEAASLLAELSAIVEAS